jgi:hypothetical protein
MKGWEVHFPVGNVSQTSENKFDTQLKHYSKRQNSGAQ